MAIADGSGDGGEEEEGEVSKGFSHDGDAIMQEALLPLYQK